MRDDQKALVKQSRELELAQMLENIENPSQEMLVIVLDLSKTFTEANPFGIEFPFKSIFIRDATDSSCQIQMKLMSDTSPYAAPLKINDSMTLGSRMKARIFWTPQPSKTMTVILFATSNFQSGTLNSLNAGGVSINDGSTAALSTLNLAAATATPILTSDANRKLGLIQNKTGGDIFIGGDATVTNAGATEGIKISDGGQIVWRNTAPVYGYSVGGGKLAIMVEK